jgi:translation initiation factor IF-3
MRTTWNRTVPLYRFVSSQKFGYWKTCSIYNEPVSCLPVRYRSYKIAKKNSQNDQESSAKPKKPQTVAVTKANKHLQINLFDENNENIGVVSMEKGKIIADGKDLKLTLIDENEKPPKFQLVTGSRLAKMQIEAKSLAKAEHKKIMSEKEIHMTLKTTDHDLEHKLKHIRDLSERGHPVNLIVESRMPETEIDKINSLQNALKKKFETEFSYTKFICKKTTVKEMLYSLSPSLSPATKNETKTKNQSVEDKPSDQVQ